MDLTETGLSNEVHLLLKRAEQDLTDKNYDSATDVFKKLLEIPMTVAILSKTNAGKRANKLKDHSHGELAKVARECLKAWMKLAESAGVPSNRPAAASSSTSSSSSLSSSSVTSTNSSNSNATTTEASTSGATAYNGAAALSPSSSNASSTSTATSSSSSSSSSTTLTTKLSATRQRIKDTIRKFLSGAILAYAKTEVGGKDWIAVFGQVHTTAEIEERCDTVSEDIEQGVFLALGKGDAENPHSAYGEQIKTIAFNLKRNIPISFNLYCGYMKGDALATMSSDDLNSEEAKKRAEETRRAQAESMQLDWVSKNKAKVLASAGLTMGEGTLVCRKCKGKNTEYSQKQTRSADEPMTTFALCNDCGWRWKFG